MSANASVKPPLKVVATIHAAVQSHLGAQLRAFYVTFASESLPAGLLDLIAQLDTVTASRKTDEAETFRRDLLEVLPGLRAFAASLSFNSAQADDLVQDTLLKAWANQPRFEPGTNLKAWLCTIMRNHFYSEIRKRKREVEDADGEAAGRLISLPNQEYTATLNKVALQLNKLPVSQREALMLVGAQGMTYEATAEVLGCQVGTVKSRVSRGRAVLVEALG